jgi:hypothetical protein
VDVTFETRADYVIDIDLGPEWRGFTATLLDAVSSRPPRGSDDACPSTCWIDRALAAVAEDRDRNTGRPFLWGNATELLLIAGEVVARAQYDTFDDERMPEEQFKEILGAWRDRVVSARKDAPPPSADH